MCGNYGSVGLQTKFYVCIGMFCTLENDDIEIAVFKIHGLSEHLLAGADPGFSWGGANPWGACSNLLLCKIFAKNCMKMKEFGPRGGVPSAPPLGSATDWHKNSSSLWNSYCPLINVLIWGIFGIWFFLTSLWREYFSHIDLNDLKDISPKLYTWNFRPVNHMCGPINLY